MTESPKPTGENMPAETPGETVARIEAIRAEERTKKQSRALGRAKWALREEERKRPNGQTPKAPTATSARAGARARHDTPVDRAKMADRVLSQLDAALDELADADPKDRASILSLAAKLSGLLADQRTEDVPFVFRGWSKPPAPLMPPGSDARCPACGQALPTVKLETPPPSSREPR